jgi:hypothetical protein
VATVSILVTSTVTLAAGTGCHLISRRAPTAAPSASELDAIASPALLDGKPMTLDSDRPSEFEDDPQAVRVQMQFDVLRVELPLRSTRYSLLVWDHVDETQNDPRLTELLARNGLRLGVASPAAWPALRALFEARRSKSLRAVHAVQSGAPLSMRVGEVQPGESVFVHARDGSLSGTTFDSGSKFLHVDYALDRDDPRRTHLRITPEIQKFSEDLHWQAGGGTFTEAPRYEGRVFADLSTDLTLGPDEFLVIGVSEEADLRPLVGGRFLQREENNMTYETVICLTPRPVRT